MVLAKTCEVSSNCIGGHLLCLFDGSPVGDTARKGRNGDGKSSFGFRTEDEMITVLLHIPSYYGMSANSASVCSSLIVRSVIFFGRAMGAWLGFEKLVDRYSSVRDELTQQADL